MADEEDIQQQMNLLATYRRTLAIYLEQVAQMGFGSIAPGIMNGITNVRNEIWHIKNNLRKQGVSVEDFFIDEPISYSSSSTNKTTQSITPPLQNKSFKHQLYMYRDIASYIKEKANYNPKQAILIQYSGASATNLLYTLADKNMHITMYIRNPGRAESELQAKRIRDTIQGLRGFFNITHKYVLNVYTYDVPASIRAVKIDEDIIGIGWYTYEHVIKYDTEFLGDECEVSGHDVPGFIFYKGSPEYEAVNDMINNQIKNYDLHIEKEGKKAILTLPDAG